jgi:hypothetical protein
MILDLQDIVWHELYNYLRHGRKLFALMALRDIVICWLPALRMGMAGVGAFLWD